MKHHFMLALLVLASGSLAADKPGPAHEHKPLHGGVVVETREMDFELVAKADVITLHLRDHGKPASSKGASGKITVLSGKDKTEATLAPAGEDQLQAQGPFKVGPGTKLVATVQLVGKKPINVRFALQ